MANRSCKRFAKLNFYSFQKPDILNIFAINVYDSVKLHATFNESDTNLKCIPFRYEVPPYQQSTSLQTG